MHFLRMHVALKTKKTKKEKGNSDFAKSRLAAGMEIRIHDEKKAFNLSRREKSDSSALPVKQHQSCSARTIQSMKAIACCKKKNNNNKKWGGGGEGQEKHGSCKIYHYVFRIYNDFFLFCLRQLQFQKFVQVTQEMSKKLNPRAADNNRATLIIRK